MRGSSCICPASDVQPAAPVRAAALAGAFGPASAQDAAPALLPGRVVAVGIPGAGAIAQLGYMHPSDTGRDAALGPALVEAPSLTLQYYGFDTTRAPFDDVRVRQAMQMAVDREAIVKSIYPTTGEVDYSTPFPQGSVGYTDALASTCKSEGLPLLPGVSTASEVMQANAAGFSFLKLFPAVAVGGVNLLKSLAGPFPDVAFCPTGGISLETAPQFLKLPNVKVCGGSWLTPQDAVDAALIALHRAQHVSATLNGAVLAPGQLDQNKISKAEFRVEKVTLSVTERLAIRKVFQALGISCKAGEEQAKAPEFLDRLLALGRATGGGVNLMALSKAAKKRVTQVTEPLLDESDDAVAHALEVAQRAI